MPKMKTKRALRGRLKVTGTGKLRRLRPGRRHILTKKTAKRKRQLKNPTLMDKSVERTYKQLMGV